MPTASLVIAVTLLAVAVIPVIVWYILWLDRTILPRLLGLPDRMARTLLELCIALPWMVAALVVGIVQRRITA